MDSLTELFCLMDDFCRRFEPAWERRRLTSGAQVVTSMSDRFDTAKEVGHFITERMKLVTCIDPPC
jgi:hypothetical protein